MKDSTGKEATMRGSQGNHGSSAQGAIGASVSAKSQTPQMAPMGLSFLPAKPETVQSI